MFCIAELLDIYRKMTNVAEDVISGLNDRNSEAELSYSKRNEKTKALYRLESQVVEQLRRLKEEAQQFTVDLRGNINLIFSGLSKTVSDVSETLRKNIFNLSKVCRNYILLGKILTIDKEVKSVQKQVQTTHTTTQSILSEIAQRNSDALLKHKNDMQSVQVTIDDLKSLLLDLNAGEMKSVILAVASLHNEIVSVSNSSNLQHLTLDSKYRMA